MSKTRTVLRRPASSGEATPASSRASPSFGAVNDAAQLVAAPAARAALMQAVRTFGRLPRQVRGTDDVSTTERNLAYRLRRARAAGHLTAEDEAELAALKTQQVAGGPVHLAAALAARADLKQAVRALGRPGAASTVLGDDENARELQGVSFGPPHTRPFRRGRAEIGRAHV